MERCFALWFAFKFVPLNHWKQQVAHKILSNRVVICFQICTFEPLETALYLYLSTRHALWFAFKFVPLNHWKQPIAIIRASNCCCDLLSNLYLWTIGNSNRSSYNEFVAVVICFQICTFEPLETAAKIIINIEIWLWFAFKFVPLNHWKQQLEPNTITTCVVICFQICTFEPLETAFDPGAMSPRLVVICFQICTFEPLETAES